MSSETIQAIIEVLSWTVLIYMLLVIVFYSTLYLISAQMVRRQRFRRKESSYLPLMRSLYTRPVSILVPAYNEEYTIVSSVQALLALDYPEHEVLVINDGSKDGTMDELFRAYELEKEIQYPRILIGSKPVKQVYRSRIDSRLIVIDKENGGKADALNAGIDYSSYPYFCSLDADSILERDALLKVMKPIVESDEEVVATCGSIFLVNGCTIEGGEIVEIRTPKQRIVLMQMIEYFRAFLFGRLGLSRFNILLIVSGAFGLFQKNIVVQAGGYKEGLVGEDMELVVRLHRYMKENKLDKRIEYVPAPVCWTQAPESMEVLRSQRTRWHRGLAETLWTHKRMIGNPKYGSVGSVSMLYFFLIELLGPIVELIGYFIIPL
ncbi:MAG: glycosyltransferase family 2 protein, partial [Exiguobacterium acetylicum]